MGERDIFQIERWPERGICEKSAVFCETSPNARDGPNVSINDRMHAATAERSITPMSWPDVTGIYLYKWAKPVGKLVNVANYSFAVST